METRRIQTGKTGEPTLPDRQRYTFPNPIVRSMLSPPDSLNRSASVQDDVIYSWSYFAGIDGFHYHGASFDTKTANPHPDSVFPYETFTAFPGTIPQDHDFGSGPVPMLGYTFFDGAHHYMVPNGVTSNTTVLRLDGSPSPGSSWTQLADTSSLHTGFFPFGFEVYDSLTNTLVILGSVSGTPHLVRYDVVSDTWSEGTLPPTVLHFCGVAVHEGKIHIIGGVPFNIDEFTVSEGTVHSDYQIYDIVSDSWSLSTPLTTIHVFGVGDYTVPPVSSSPVVGFWCERVFPLSATGGRAVDGNIYFFGGRLPEPGSGAFSGTFGPIFVYNTAFGMWTQPQYRQAARNGGAALRDTNTTVVSLSDGRLVYACLGEFTGDTWGIYDVEVPNKLMGPLTNEVVVAGNSSTAVYDRSDATVINLEVPGQVTQANFTGPQPIPPPGGDPPPIVPG